MSENIEIENESEETGEEEDKSASDLPMKPWNPNEIRITTKNFTIREIYTQIEDKKEGDEKELDLAPDFQRSFVWDIKRQVRLIESILLGIPLPAFYFNQDKDGAQQVIDGVQRLTTIKNFMSNKLELKKEYLEYLWLLQGSTFINLDALTKRRFSGTQIVAHVIEPQTPDDVKYDIFNRVNTGGSPLNAQEIRHCMSKSKSREFLRKLVESPSFDLALGNYFWKKNESGQLVRNNKRMVDRELVLRFCAFYTVQLEDYSNASSLDAFLLEFSRRIDQKSEGIDLGRLESAFERAMQNCYEVMGAAAFRRCKPGENPRGGVNRAIFESQALALADYPLEVVLPRKDDIKQVLQELFNDPEYDDAVKFGTGSYRKIKNRINKPRNLLAEILR